MTPAAQPTTVALRAMTVVASIVAIAGTGVTLYVLAVHDPDDGANIGGGIGIIGSALAVAAVIVAVVARGRSPLMQTTASMGTGLLIFVSLLFLLLIRPFD